MEFIYTAHFLVTVLAFTSMMCKSFRVVGGVIFSLNIINYLILFFSSPEFLTSKYGIIPTLFTMDLVATCVLLNIHKKMKDTLSLKIVVVMYFFAITHLFNFIALFIIWGKEPLSRYWGDISQLDVAARIMYHSYENIIFGLTLLLVVLFINSGIQGFINGIDSARLFLFNRRSLGSLHGSTSIRGTSNLQQLQEIEREP